MTGSFSGQQFGQQAVFPPRARKSAAWLCHECQRGQRKSQRMRSQPGCRQEHGHKFHHLGPDRDLALAESICQPAARHTQNEKRHREEKRHHADQRFPLTLRQIHPDDHRQQQVAQNVVAEGALEQCGNQRPKSPGDCAECRSREKLFGLQQRNHSKRCPSASPLPGEPGMV